MEKTDIVIIGAGIVGLSVGARLAGPGRQVYIIERHDSFGRETSSRNSEVIHAGIYYPQHSLKAGLCVEGNRILYEICKKNNIPHKRIEKLIVATNPIEEGELAALLKKGEANGTLGLKILSEKEIKKLEPNIKARAALYSPDTGIIDSHRLMKYFKDTFTGKGGQVAYNCNVAGLTKIKSGYEVAVKETNGETFKFNSRIIINSAGLESDTIASMVGIDIVNKGYCLKYCKGQYFRVTNSKKAGLIKKLIYPVPHERITGLGVHATKDLNGGLRLGPDAHYIKRENINYDVDRVQKKFFLDSALKFLPFLKEEDLSEDTAGIRPKLQGENDNFCDFVIKEESDAGFPGFINLIGIESPGLTAAPAIAKYVKGIIVSLG